ncbi:class I SAM-dependent methyltransferase [Bradyrhizobium sp. AZCC 2230]|uniref:class I SAM-dependent methyltransferase n=1 Tax=Bradyrhizobium sp. AZCC 2230 TaxID=3117021 RepID=UPI002FF2E947
MPTHVPQAFFIDRQRCINCGSTNFSELSNGRYTDEPLHGFLAADPWGEDPLPHLQSATWSLAKCSDCAQIFHRRILNEEWNERRFSRWMSADAIVEFERRLGPAFPRTFSSATAHVEHILRIEAVTRSIRGQEAVRLLDFGCGFGSFIEACTHFGFEAIGVDRSVGRRSKAAVDIKSSLDDVAGKFHAITLFEVMEHLDSPNSVLANLAELAAPGAILVLETPDCAGLTDILTARDHRLADPLEHINCFTHTTLKSIAERNGFRPIQRPPVFVMADLGRAAKRMAKHAMKRDGKSTQLYFRKD